MNVRMFGVMRLASTSRRKSDFLGAPAGAWVSALGSAVAMAVRGAAGIAGGAGRGP